MGNKVWPRKLKLEFIKRRKKGIIFNFFNQSSLNIPLSISYQVNKYICAVVFLKFLVKSDDKVSKQLSFYLY